MRLLHSLARTHASFDDPDLVSRAGLVPVMALAQRAGLTELVAEQVGPGGPCGVHAPVKVRRLRRAVSVFHPPISRVLAACGDRDKPGLRRQFVFMQRGHARGQIPR